MVDDILSTFGSQPLDLFQLLESVQRANQSSTNDQLQLPFLVLALASGLIMPYFSRIKSHLLLLKRIGGLLIILMGILLMLGQLNVLSGIFG